MVRKRNWFLVILFSFITFGLYGIYWYVVTKKEMTDLGADIPTAFLVIIPIVNIYWLWKYSKGVESISNGNTNGVLLFIIWLVFSPVAIYLTQTELNKHAEGSSPMPAEPVGAEGPAKAEQPPKV